MALILLDATGRIVGLVGLGDPSSTLAEGQPAGPSWTVGLVQAASLPQHLADLARVRGGSDIDALQMGLDAVLGGRQSHFEQRHADGAWSVQVQACTDGGPLAAVVLIDRLQDATLREQLTAAERRLATVQQVAGLGTWHVDVHSGRVQWSPEIYSVLGVDPAVGPLRSAMVRARVHPEDLPRLRADRARVLAGEPLVTSHFRFRRDDGSECWLESRVTLEPATAGRPAGIVGTVRDVSEGNRGAGRGAPPAAAGDRAETLGRVKSAFLAHTSHEIRTPLNVIVSLSHLMRCSLTDPAQRGRAQAVEHAAHHLSSIVDDVLAVAQDEVSPPRYDSQPLDPAALLAEVASILGPQAETRGLRFELSAPQPGPGTAVRGDVARLRQALLNAAGRAVALAPGGSVRLQAQLGPAQGLQRPLWLVVESDAPLPTPGAQTDPQWVALERLAHQMLARLQVDGLPGGGSRCSLAVDLMVDDAADMAADPAAAPVPADQPEDAASQIRRRHRGSRVLLAEDDDINQLAMQELLADVGLEVDTAVDGHEAVDRASRRAYALILLDLRMPHLDGVGAARAIRALPDHHATPMVAVTANAFDEDRQACRAAGMNDFMAKPIEVRSLYDMLLHWLDRGPTAAPAAAAPALRTQVVAPAPVAAAASVNSAPAEPDPMHPLLGLEGVDALGGLASVGGKPAVYRRLLGIFIDTHQGDGAQLQRLLLAGDPGAACSLAHRVRGSAATLGLIDIEVAAAALEGAIDEPTPGAAPGLPGLLAQAVGQALDSTLQRLHEALAR